MKSQLQEAADECRDRQALLDAAKEKQEAATKVVNMYTELLTVAQQNLEGAYRVLQEANNTLNYQKQQVETSIVTMRSLLAKASPYESYNEVKGNPF